MASEVSPKLCKARCRLNQPMPVGTHAQLLFRRTKCKLSKMKAEALTKLKLSKPQVSVGILCRAKCRTKWLTSATAASRVSAAPKIKLSNRPPHQTSVLVTAAILLLCRLTKPRCNLQKEAEWVLLLTKPRCNLRKEAEWALLIKPKPNRQQQVERAIHLNSKCRIRCPRRTRLAAVLQLNHRLRLSPQWGPAA